MRAPLRQKDERGRRTMKIAVTYEGGQVFQHFGHTQHFKLYQVEDGKVAGSQLLDTQGQGHGALAGLLAQAGVDTLICGGIGGGARQALAQAGVKLYPGVTGPADQAVEALLAGTLAYNPDTQCNHHRDEGEGCGHHHHGGESGCGHHHGGESGCGHHHHGGCGEG